MTSALTLSDDQQAAYLKFATFLLDPEQTVMLISGYAGTGKTTLIRQLVANLPATLKMAALTTGMTLDWDLLFTATTNKAVQALTDIIGQEAKTIQSALGLRVHKDHHKNTTSLVLDSYAEHLTDTLLFIDEISFADQELLNYIIQRTRNCKIVLIGDPAQLAPPGSRYTPAFNSNFNETRLKQVMRQAEGNPIIAMATAFRKTVGGAGWGKFKLDGNTIQHLPQAEFEAQAIAEASRPDWKHGDSKVLAWTNARVVYYNHLIRKAHHGDPQLQVNDYAVCNQYINQRITNEHGKRVSFSIKTDELVQITGIRPTTSYGVNGWEVFLNNKLKAFLPNDIKLKKQLIAELTAQQKNKSTLTSSIIGFDDNIGAVRKVEDYWIDLRAAYACTINKAQGSTYNKVFIDLNDIKKCRQGDQVARMMYVAVSRARYNVILTGDLV
jgi:hypothetical protein